MLPKDLIELWNNVGAAGFDLPAIEFYGHATGAPTRCFSNFFEHAPFDFSIPATCGRAELEATGRSAIVSVTFTEKAIMLCKAAIMGDMVSFDAIARASTPGKAKVLGRKVGPWNASMWDRLVCDVAREVALQKFRALPQLAEILLATGNHVIAEMTRNDLNWGTGIDMNCGANADPTKWGGTNILGWSLMVARAQLRKERAGGSSTPDGRQGRKAEELNSECCNKAM